MQLSERLENMGREALGGVHESLIFRAVQRVFDVLAEKLPAALALDTYVLSTDLRSGWNQKIRFIPEHCFVSGPVADVIRNRLEMTVQVDERAAVWAKFALGACANRPVWWTEEVEELVENVIMRTDQAEVAQPYECFEHDGVLRHGSEFNGEIFAAKLNAVSGALAAYAACAEAPTETNIPAVEEALVSLGGAMDAAGFGSLLHLLSDPKKAS